MHALFGDGVAVTLCPVKYFSAESCGVCVGNFFRDDGVGGGVR